MVALEERSNSMISNDKLKGTEKSVLNDLEKIDSYLQDNLI
jgi:hypothetical protein